MALTVVWERVAVDRADNSTLVVNRGEVLPDFVSDFIRSTLVMIGAVKDVTSVVQTVQDAVDHEFEPEPAPPAYPPEVPPVTPAVTPAPAVVVEKPSVSDNKDTWEAYAVDRGYMSQTEAEAMTKVKLIAAVNDREKV